MVRTLLQDVTCLPALAFFSNPAHASIITLDRYCAAAPTGPAFIRIIIVSPITVFTVAGPAQINSNSAGTNVHTLRGGGCWSGTNHCTGESKRDQRTFNPHCFSRLR